LIDSYENFYKYGPTEFHIAELDKVKPEMMRPVIDRYFRDIKTAFEVYAQKNGGNGYKIGMYCTAAMCQHGVDSEWAEYFWLSPEGRDRKEYREFLKRDEALNLVQQLPTKCQGLEPSRDRKSFEFDFNQVNSRKPDFGQWDRKRPR
jgi:hypothetical protein